MKKRISTTLALALALAAPGAALAAGRGPAPHIAVTGEGEMAVKPDLAIVTLTVMREAPTASEALTDDNKAMADVIAALKAEGVRDRDLQTANLSISPRYANTAPQKPEEQAKIVAYQVANTLTVRVRAIGKVGTVIDKAVKLGVNEDGAIDFANDDPSAATTEARKRAVADAVKKAHTLAEAAHVKVGKVLQISEQSYAPRPVPMRAKTFAAADAVPVAPGENNYRVTVSMTFELDQ
jgi:uncharacterized protein YggE